MTPFSSSVHTHSDMCDGRDTLAAMAEAAYVSGVRFFGASGHSHTPVRADEGFVLPAHPVAYLAEIRRLRELYDGRMEVLAGLELDSIADAPAPEGLNYIIGSVHYISEPDGSRCAVDLTRDCLEKCRDRAFGGDIYALVESYYAAVSEATGKRPDILGHFDLITKFNDGSLLDEEAPRYRAAALAALHSADPESTLLEINTAAVAAGLRKTPYPALFLLREWRKMGGSIAITSDSHRVDTILFGYAGAIEIARAAGYNMSVTPGLSGPAELPFG